MGPKRSVKFIVWICAIVVVGHVRLSDLMQDIRRLMILGYGSESSPIWESVAANAFLDALNDPVLALEVRKRNIATLDGAYREAALLEGFSKAST
jgi:hypothetical protein